MPALRPWGRPRSEEPHAVHRSPRAAARQVAPRTLLAHGSRVRRAVLHHREHAVTAAAPLVDAGPRRGAERGVRVRSRPRAGAPRPRDGALVGPACHDEPASTRAARPHRHRVRGPDRHQLPAGDDRLAAGGQPPGRRRRAGVVVSDRFDARRGRRVRPVHPRLARPRRAHPLLPHEGLLTHRAGGSGPSRRIGHHGRDGRRGDRRRRRTRRPRRRRGQRRPRQPADAAR